jgi:hypothetical protein
VVKYSRYQYWYGTMNQLIWYNILINQIVSLFLLKFVPLLFQPNPTIKWTPKIKLVKYKFDRGIHLARTTLEDFVRTSLHDHEHFFLLFLSQISKASINPISHGSTLASLTECLLPTTCRQPAEAAEPKFYILVCSFNS